MSHRPPLEHSATADSIPGLHASDNLSLAVPAVEEGGRPPVIKHISAPAYQSPLRHHKRAPSKSRPVKETLNARSEYSNSEDDGAAVHRINQYEIKQEIGRGSFGAVHLAVDQYGTEFAVKEFSKSRLRKRAQTNLLRRPNQIKRPGALAAGTGFNSPLHRHASEDGKGQRANNALDLIKEEIAIMKKLNHNNLVSLIEVLDDPDEDSLYMVLEYCKKGVVMKVGLDERADPYDEESCRCWFRDMILGMEYLHAQGIIHRDIKPDNCLITEDDVLKIVDFGVSEMFEKDADMNVAKSAGSPAFMPPELCVARHGPVSGKAADIWSMGVTLYCLRFGKIPFEKTGVLDLYESIRKDSLDVESDCNGQCTGNLKDLLKRLLTKDPDKRITMDEIRVHPWVTQNGTDPLLAKEENIADLIEPPTQEELAAAITGNMKHLLVVMKAVKRFKKLLFRKRPELMEGIFGRASKIVQPPLQMRNPSTKQQRTQSIDLDDRVPLERALAAEGVNREVQISDKLESVPTKMDSMVISDNRYPGMKPSNSHRKNPETAEGGRGDTEGTRLQKTETQTHKPPASGAAPVSQSIAKITQQREDHARSTPQYPPGKGQARNPLLDTLFLDVGPGPANVDTPQIIADDMPHALADEPSFSSFSVADLEAPRSNTVPGAYPTTPLPTSTPTMFLEPVSHADHVYVISQSPSAVDINVYETAYQEEVKRILENKGRSATLFLNRRVEGNQEIRDDDRLSGRSDDTDLPSGSATFPGASESSKKGGLAGLLAKVRDREGNESPAEGNDSEQ